jgi:hypothetical protein
MPYKMAGIDVHKRCWWSWPRSPSKQSGGKFGATASELRRLAEWFQQRGVQEVVEGVYPAIWETDLGHVGAVLDAGEAATGRRRARGREAPFGPVPVPSRTPGPEER